MPISINALLQSPDQFYTPGRESILERVLTDDYRRNLINRMADIDINRLRSERPGVMDRCDLNDEELHKRAHILLAEQYSEKPSVTIQWQRIQDNHHHAKNGNGFAIG